MRPDKNIGDAFLFAEANIQALDANMVGLVRFLLEIILIRATNDDIIIASGGSKEEAMVKNSRQDIDITSLEAFHEGRIPW